MELLKKLFDKNTNHGRGFRTAIQCLLALITFVYGLMAIPGLGAILASNDVTTLASYGTLVGLVAYIQNAIEDLWERVR